MSTQSSAFSADASRSRSGEPALHLDRARVVAHVAEQPDSARSAGTCLGSRSSTSSYDAIARWRKPARAEIAGEIGETRDPLVAVEVAPQEQALVQPDRAADVAAHPIEAREREVRLDARSSRAPRSGRAGARPARGRGRAPRAAPRARRPPRRAPLPICAGAASRTSA
jgi:hypothetical protein